MTLSERLALTRGRPAGFDYLRFGLASMIVVWHTVIISYGLQAQRALVMGPTRPLWSMLLPMFFALSGFLVSGSLERSRTLVSFLGLRVLRLLPALLVESLVSMLLLGPFLTTFSWREYFRDPLFSSYLLNIVGDVHFFLPGLFTNNPTPAVNGQLWTLPYELKCYLLISFLATFGIYRSWFWLLVACIAVQAYTTYRALYVFTNANDDAGIVGGSMLTLAFLYGSLQYRLRDKISWSRSLSITSLVISAFLMYFHGLNTLAAFPIAYSTIYLGLLNPPRSRVVSSGDYSYGIFLYGFPIQQAVSALFPHYRFWWFNLAIAGPIVFAVAWASWHFVESKALKGRKTLSRAELWFIPFHDGLSGLYRRLLSPGLRVRWGRPR